MKFESLTNATKKTVDSESEFNLNLITSTIAHEIRNPLQSMRLQLDEAIRGKSSQDTFESLSRGLDRLERIVNRIQSFSHRYHLKIERIDLKTVLDSVLDSLRFWLKAAGIEVIEHIQWEGRPICCADRELLEQVILNLVTNAIQAMPQGGRLSLLVNECENSAQIEVTDTGCGMKNETLHSVGTPFFTTKEKGSGLGIAFCKSIISMHGGSLKIESEIGKGTRVKMMLPKGGNGEVD